jgi:integrase
MPEFILSTRAASSKLYVSYKNPLTGKYGTKRSTGTSDPKQAEKIAYKWLITGEAEKKNDCTQRHLLDAIQLAELTPSDAREIIEILKFKNLISSAVLKSDKANVNFIAFLENFWDYDNSPYIKEKLRKKHGIHKRYVARCSGAIKNYWKPYFGDATLGSITREQLNAFIDKIGTLEKPASAKGKNDIIKAGTLALKWAARGEILDKDITSGFLLFSGEEKKREILTPELVRAIYSRKWKSETAKLANILAMCTGLRAGEIQGLRKCDLGESCIYIQHSWNLADGLKSTKNGEARTVEIVFPEVMAALIDLANANPWNEGLEGYVFWASVPNKPIEAKGWLKELRLVCKEIGMHDPSWVTFHAWRHFFTTHMSGKVEDKILQKATGHKTLAMLEHYADHRKPEEITMLKIAQKEVFEPFFGKNS